MALPHFTPYSNNIPILIITTIIILINHPNNSNKGHGCKVLSLLDSKTGLGLEEMIHGKGLETNLHGGTWNSSISIPRINNISHTIDEEVVAEGVAFQKIAIIRGIAGIVSMTVETIDVEVIGAIIETVIIGIDANPRMIVSITEDGTKIVTGTGIDLMGLVSLFPDTEGKMALPQPMNELR